MRVYSNIGRHAAIKTYRTRIYVRSKYVQYGGGCGGAPGGIPSVDTACDPVIRPVCDCLEN